MRKLKVGFSGYNADDLIDLGGKAGPAVAGIPRFAGITPSPATIAAQVADLIAKRTASGRGTTVAVRAAKATLAGSLSLMATNLNDTAGATPTELAQTQFPMVKVRERTTSVPDAPQDLRLRHGRVSQEVLASCKIPMEKIRLLEVQWTLDPSGDTWTESEPSTNSRRIVLKGLPRGKDVWVRVRARNVLGAGPWSDPATIMVL